MERNSGDIGSVIRRIQGVETGVLCAEGDGLFGQPTLMQGWHHRLHHDGLNGGIDGHGDAAPCRAYMKRNVQCCSCVAFKRVVFRVVEQAGVQTPFVTKQTREVMKHGQG